ncbi:MAG TPA: hypothetical protein VGG14_07510 [Candidatus Sulfotelmatobacter sp.]|jgi:hypothetical protein
MDAESLQPILDELFSSLEPLDAQSSAILQFLKSKGLATDEELAPFLEQAADAASVRWLAVRVRTAALLANLLNPTEQESFTASAQANARPAPQNDRSEGQANPNVNSPDEKRAESESMPGKVESAGAQGNESAKDDVKDAA